MGLSVLYSLSCQTTEYSIWNGYLKPYLRKSKLKSVALEMDPSVYEIISQSQVLNELISGDLINIYINNCDVSSLNQSNGSIYLKAPIKS